MDWYVASFFFLIFTYRLSQFYAIIKAKNLYKPNHQGDYGIALVWGPLTLAVILAPYDYLLRQESAGVGWIVLGSSFFIIATVIRGKSLADISKEFFFFHDKGAIIQIHTNGIYHHIRHPLYLSNIIFMLACATYFKSMLAFLAFLLGIAGVIVKTNLEEKALSSIYEDFNDYKLKTAKLLPRIY
ncbi:MAG: methyltransferase [Bacillota bacterium]|nr:methyltransferase [Bacillota bacterium]